MDWQYHLRLGDVFSAETLSFTQRRNAIVARIQNAPFYDDWDRSLTDIVEELLETENQVEFDEVWPDFSDYADEHGIWITTTPTTLEVAPPVLEATEVAV